MPTEQFIGDKMKDFMKSINIPPTQTNFEHFDIMLRALYVFNERNEVRGDLWAEHEPKAAMDKTREKHMRVERVLDRLRSVMSGPRDEPLMRARLKTEGMDDAVDAVNEAVFVARHVLGWKGGHDH